MRVPSPLMTRLLIAGLLCAVPQAAFGRFVPFPRSYVMLSEDGQQMLVMPASSPFYTEDDQFTIEAGDIITLANGQVVNLRKDYPAPGLYRIGSFKPIWTVDWYSRQGYVWLGPDCRYVVRVREWERFEDWAFSVYDRGAEIASYTSDELIPFPSPSVLPLESWGRRADVWSGEDFSIEDVRWGACKIAGSYGGIYRLRVSSGEMLGVWSYYGNLLLLWAFMFLLPGPVLWAAGRFGRGERAPRVSGRAAGHVLLAAYAAGNLILLVLFWKFDNTFPTALLAWLVAQASLIAVWTTRSRRRRPVRFLLAGAALAWTWWLTTFVAARDDLGGAGSVALALMFVAQLAAVVAAVNAARWVSRRKEGGAWRPWRVQVSLRCVLFAVALAAVGLGLWRYVFVHLGWRPDGTERVCLIRGPVLGACNAAGALLVLASLCGRRWLPLRMVLAAVTIGLLGHFTPDLLRLVADVDVRETIFRIFLGGSPVALTPADALTLAGLQAACLYAALLPLRLAGGHTLRQEPGGTQCDPMPCDDSLPCPT